MSSNRLVLSGLGIINWNILMLCRVAHRQKPITGLLAQPDEAILPDQCTASHLLAKPIGRHCLAVVSIDYVALLLRHKLLVGLSGLLGYV